MVDHEEELSAQTLKCAEDDPQNRGVVVCLSTHRRWRSRCSWDQVGGPDDESTPVMGAEDWQPQSPIMKEETETATVQEPGLWLAGLVALMSFALIIGLYWASTAAIKAAIALSFTHF